MSKNSSKHWSTCHFLRSTWSLQYPISEMKQHIIFPLLCTFLQVPETQRVLPALQMPGNGVFFVVFEGCREVKALENEQLSVFRDFYSTFRASGRARRENPWGCLFGIQSTGSRASSSTHSASTERQLFNPCRVNIHSGACQERREIKRRALHLLFKKGE